MTMGCDEVRDLLALRVEGALEPAEAASVEAHLELCAACRKEEERERAAWRALEALPGATPPAGFASRVALAARSARTKRRLLPFAAAASVAAAAFLGSVALRGGPSDEEVIANLDLLQSWDLVADPDFAVALDAPEEELLALDGENGG